MATLDDTIDLLQTFGPSVLLVRCLVLAHRFEEACEMSRVVAPIESAHLAKQASQNLEDTAELRLRCIFSELVAGSHRNARLLLTAFIEESEQVRNTSERFRSISNQLAIGALLVDEPELSRRVLSLISNTGSLTTRILEAWVFRQSQELASCMTELRQYVADSNLAVWSDTWHHIILNVLSGELVFDHT